MCEHCENGHPTGVDLDDAELPESCPDNLAECIRDTVRLICYAVKPIDSFDANGDDLDRYLNELCRRASPKPPK